MKSLVEYTEFLVKSISKDPDMIKVECFDSDEETKIIEVIVPSSEMSRIIGSGGKTATAIRTLVQAYAYTNNLSKVKINIDSF